MKKIIFAIAFLSFFLLFSQPAQAIYVQVTFNITSVTAPARALAVYLPANTEVGILGVMAAYAGYNRAYLCQIKDNSNNVVAERYSEDLLLRRNTPGSPGRNFVGPTIVTFNDNGQGPYVPRIKLSSMGPGTNITDLGCASKVNGYYVEIYKEDNSYSQIICPSPNQGINAPSSQYLYFNLPEIP